MVIGPVRYHEETRLFALSVSERMSSDGGGFWHVPNGLESFGARNLFVIGSSQSQHRISALRGFITIQSIVDMVRQCRIA